MGLSIRVLLLYCIGCLIPISNNVSPPPTSNDLENILKEVLAIIKIKNDQRETAKSEHGYHYNGDTPVMKHHGFQRGDAESYAMDSNQARYEEMTRSFKSRQYTDEQMKMVAKETMDCPAKDYNCDPNSRYRTFDGTCNNLKHPEWAKAKSCFSRMMKPVYSDGVSKFRKAKSGRDLSTPREVSVGIHGFYNEPDRQYTHMMMQFGQFLDHDFTKSLSATKSDGSPLQCCSKNEDPECADIVLSKDDDFYSAFNFTCLPNPRTQRCRQCEFGPRNQLNGLTSVIDASLVYGNSKEEANSLRKHHGGLMKSYFDKDYGELLPRVPASSTCKKNKRERCFLCADTRCNQHPGIQTMHTIFLRLHNNIVRDLAELNRHWGDEKLYQEGRRIVGAVIQCVTYKEYVPLVVGIEAMTKWDLFVGKDSEYNPDLNPTLKNEFATAAFRFGHPTITDFAEVHKNGGIDTYELRDKFFDISAMYSGRLETISKGLLVSPSKHLDRYCSKDVTNHLFQSRGTCYGSDLISFDIIRGRDHGIPPYTQMLKFLGGLDIKTFEDLEKYGLLQNGLAKVLESVYEDVEDIDLFTGGVIERCYPGAIVSRTFRDILALQFHDLKFGDRFYFGHVNQPTSFTAAQRKELRKATLGNVMCYAQLGMEHSQRNVFLLPGPGNPLEPCLPGPLIDLRHWQESGPSGVESGPYPGSHEQQASSASAASASG